MEEGARSEFCVAKSRDRRILRAGYDKSCYKVYPEGGDGSPAHLVAQPMTHGVATPTRFQIRASFVSGQATQKIQSPFFLTFPLSARDRRSFANNVADRRVPEVSDSSPFLLILLFFFIIVRVAFLTMIERAKDPR